MRNLSKTFNIDTINETTIFDNLSVDVNDGDFISIIGSNGAGKSTFLNLIGGSLEKDEGSILLDGKDISNLKEYDRAKFIGRVFQNPALGTVSSMTVLENLSLAYNKGKKYNLSKAVNKENIPYFKKLLSQLSLGLEEKLDVKVGLLSGGQRQSLSILMSTMANPKLLLLDEHTAALYWKTSEKIMELTERIVAEKNITTLMVTHNLSHAIKYGNRLFMLHEGKILFDIEGEEKLNLTIEKVLSLFEKMQVEGNMSDKMLFV